MSDPTPGAGAHDDDLDVATPEEVDPTDGTDEDDMPIDNPAG